MMSKEYWYCYVGVSEPQIKNPVKKAIKDIFEKVFQNRLDYQCFSGLDIDDEKAKHISFASLSDISKRAVINSYKKQKKNLPRHIKAWDLLLREEDKKEIQDKKGKVLLELKPLIK
jgi:hypothetical protein